MSVGKSRHRGQVPNWIDHGWTPGERIEWLRVVTALSPRDWSKYPHAIGGYDDPESYAVYLLVHANGRIDALDKWNAFCFGGCSG